MTYDDEVLIDQEVKEALDTHLLSWEGVTPGNLFGGVSYHVGDAEFAILMEGVVAARLPRELRARGFGLAGVSPFRPPSDEEGFDEWVQFVLLLAEDVTAVVPWLEEAFKYTASMS